MSPNKEAGSPRVSEVAFERYRLLSLIGRSSMGKVIATAVAAVALGPFSVVAAAPVVAHAAPCAGAGADPKRCNYCLFLVNAYHTSNASVCNEDAPPHPAQAPPSRVPVPNPEPPPLPVLPEPPSVTSVQTPQVVPPSPSPPSTIPAHTINPLPPGAAGNAPLVAPPQGVDASREAVAAAKAAPATRINPGMAHQMLQQVDFNHQVQNVVNAHSGNVDVIQADNQSIVRPRHWDYVDYDDYHRPALYNPLNQAMTFRYFYNGADREAYVPAGGRIVLDVATVGLFPFTAVGDSYVAVGSFRGGAWIPPDGNNGPPPPNYTPPAPPEVYQDVAVDVPAGSQIVKVGQVVLVSHDQSQPAGSQDTFLLDDSTLAWGQINDPGSNAQIKVTKTQSLPSVGPTDNGSYLVALTAHQEPAQPAQSWWPSALRYGLLVIGVGLFAWAVSRFGNRTPADHE